ncbi:MAG: glycosyltransferase [Hyphomonadaceae bacterium]
MRVLQVMAGAAAGGAETMMLDGTLALAEAGVEQRAITRPDSAERLNALKRADVPVALASFDRLWRLPTQRAIAAALRDFKPDVLHFWMGRAGGFAPQQTRARNLAWYGGYYKIARFRNCAWHAGVTSDIARAVIAQGAPPERVSVLHTYANIPPAAEPIARAALNTPDDAPVILVLARLHWKKGVDTMLDALPGLPGAHLWIAGAGPLENDLKAQAHKLGLADRAHFLGWRDDRARLLAACDVVAFPSRYEPFGNVTPEAWAAKKPLVVADAAGPAATVTHEHDALLVPKDNPEALRAALARVIADKALAAKLVENGAQSLETHYTKAAFVSECLALYQRIVAAAPDA